MARTFVAAVYNAPEHEGRRGLLPPVQRARGVLAHMKAHNVSLAFVQESGTYLQRAAAGSIFRASYGVANVLRRGGKIKRGNGFLIRRDDWRITRYGRRITTTIPSGRRFRSKTTLTLPVRLLTHRETGERVWVVCVHRPIKRRAMYRAARYDLDRKLIEFCDEHRDELVIVAGDFNGSPPWLRNLRVAGRYGVDAILSSYGLLSSVASVHRLKGLSDHHAVSVVYSLPRKH